MNACNCIGPQPGQPRCPCMMNRRKTDPQIFEESPLIDKKRLVIWKENILPVKRFNQY